MKRMISLWLVVFTFLVVSGRAAPGVEKFPKPVGLVNDFAGVIPEGDRRKMEILATEVLQKTGTSVVVAAVPTIGDSDAATYANELYQAWGIGKKGEDKGVLILLALKERRVRIETGYGVEGILPDGLVGEILDKYVVPLLKKGEYGKGLYNGLAAVSVVIAKDAHVELTGEVKIYRTSPRRAGRIGIFPLIFIILIILSFLRRGRGGILPLLLLSSMGGRGGFGGGFGGFGGGFGGFGGGMSGGGGAGRGF
ncbi:MAG: TPM domain-containing protein [Deltaproteobacteria bacterium]|nr:TPM domain-containing protein [Deltaproteobacteria bacterium]MBW2121174.1 TPM domain-containing protein [Deltaproteobacteria bacterium]